MNTSPLGGGTLVSLGEWLTCRSALTPQELERIFTSLAEQVAAVHDQGLLHGDLTVDSIVVDMMGEPKLTGIAGTSESKHLDLALEQLPPELRAYNRPIPRKLGIASQVLLENPEPLDARRIDVYQLGALFVRVAANAHVDAYLLQPLVSARIPLGLRKVVDRAIGVSSAQRISDCRRLSMELEQAFQAFTPGPDTPARGSALGSDTDRGEPRSRQPWEARERLGNYQIVGQIGSGGMGDVFKGYDADLDRHVAIKVLPPELARQPDFVARFRVEAAAVAKVEHPNIVPIYSIGADRGQHFFAMQFVEGQTLAQLLAAQPKQSPAETFRLVEQIVAGLAAAHRRGLVHRDIKPGNILLADEGARALVADFGLVKHSGNENRMTATGLVMGTVDYLSPEQGRGRAVDGRSDLYSVGVLMYQMLAGQLPFVAETPTATIFQHVYEPPPPLAKVAPHVPAALAGVVHRLLAKLPEDRYQTCEELLKDLAALRIGKSLIPSPGQTPRGEARTAMVLAPKFADEVHLVLSPAARADEPGLGENIWQHLFFWVRKQSPELARRLENTQQQVDGAIFEYQRRCDSLSGLLREAAEALRSLETQLSAHRSAAEAARLRLAIATDEDAKDEARTSQALNDQAATELQQQLSQQRSELESMQLELAKASARLASLTSQRDALRARLRMAQVRLNESAAPARGRRRVLTLAAIGTVAVSIVLAVVYVAMNAKGKPIARAPPKSVSPPTQPKEEPVPVAKSPATASETVKSQPVPKPANPAPEPALPAIKIEPRQPIEETEAASGGPTGPFAISVKKIASIPGFDSSSAILSVTFSPNGKLLAASDRRTVRVCDVATASEKVRLTGPTDTVHSLTFSHDGKFLAGGCHDKTIRIWNVEQARLNTTIEGSDALVTRVQYSPNDSLIVSNGVRLWRSSGKPLGKLSPIPGTDLWPQIFAFQPNDHRAVLTLVAAGRSAEGQCLTLIRGENQQNSDDISQWKWNMAEVPTDDPTIDLRSAIHSPDGKTLAVLGVDRIDLIDIAKSKIRSTLAPTRKKYFYSGSISPDSSMIAVAGDKITIWNLRTGQELHSMETHFVSWSIDFSSQGNTFAVSTGSSVDIYEITDEKAP